ncbi:MAG: flagellar biosynthesis protein [Firmicutes bacterium]|nr:flagellar biosynthesis protein [Bacillota bacterium]
MKVNQPYGQIPPMPGTAAGQAGKKKAVSPVDTSFAQVLAQQFPAPQLKFSAHAKQRMQSRQINLGAADVEKLSKALLAADKKGARASLLLYDDIAFIASVKNNTIITAINGDELKEHVFTNIDSAVLIK